MAARMNTLFAASLTLLVLSAALLGVLIWNRTCNVSLDGIGGSTRPAHPDLGSGMSPAAG